MGSLRKTFYIDTQDYYFPKRIYANYLVLILEMFPFKFSWKNRKRYSQNYRFKCCEQQSFYNAVFLYMTCRSHYCLLLSEGTYFSVFLLQDFFSQKCRAQQLFGELNKWCQNPPWAKTKGKQSIRLLRKDVASRSRVLTHSDERSTRQPVPVKQRARPAFSQTNMF